MLSSYEDFKDALTNFHPEKIDYTYDASQIGWIEDAEEHIKLVTESDNSWDLYIIDKKDRNSRTHINSYDPNAPLSIRDLLMRVDKIHIEDFIKDMIQDSDIDYPKN